VAKIFTRSLARPFKFPVHDHLMEWTEKHAGYHICGLCRTQQHIRSVKDDI
jgi:uncharacterized protein YfaT (DUF1175 family)